MVAPFIIIGGILLGVFTPTESGAVAVLFIIAVGFLQTRRLTVKKLWVAARDAARLTSVIFLVIGGAAVIGWLLTYERVPTRFAEFISSTVQDPLLLLLLLSGMVFLFGMFMEEIASLILLTPIFAPLALGAGIDPYHFGIVMVLNITIALITPPMGGCLFIASAVGRVPLGLIFRHIWPFVTVAVITLLIIILIPGLTTILPALFGL